MNIEDSNDHPDEIDLMILPWVTLFPGALLPLYIFEQRYRDMTQAALAGNRMFAIAHSNDEKTVAAFGGLGVIRACVTNEDGTLNLVLQGVSRVEFSNIRKAPRPNAQIRVLRDSDEPPELAHLREKILQTCEGILAGGVHAQEGFIEYLRECPSHSGFTDIACSTLIDDPEERRKLFETLELKARMELLLEMLPAKFQSL